MATPHRENILKFRNRSFMIRHERIHFSDETSYHLHPEMELAILEGGGGTRCVNGMEEQFGELDVVFVPGDIPHSWTFEAERCPPDGIITDSSCQFPLSLLLCIGKTLPEFTEIMTFYKELRQAIQIGGETAVFVRKQFHLMSGLSDFRQTMAILSVLTEIYQRREYRMIGSPLPADSNISHSAMRLHLIERFVSDNYNRKITLRDAADTVGMSPTAFCNAFKAMTGTTFNKYLNSYRMRIAARLLRETTLPVSEIGFSVGYSELAHFTRAFTVHFNIPPSKFRSESIHKIQ